MLLGILYEPARGICGTLALQIDLIRCNSLLVDIDIESPRTEKLIQLRNKFSRVPVCYYVDQPETLAITCEVLIMQPYAFL